MSSDAVSVPAKLLSLLDAYTEGCSEYTLSELSRRTGLPLTTAHRLVGELERWGGLERGEDGKYRIGLRLVEIAALCPRGTGLRDIALPFMQDLYEATHQNVQLAVREGTDGVYIERIAGRHAVAVRTRVGAHWPLHATGVGLVLLAFAPRAMQETVLAAPLRAIHALHDHRPDGAAPGARRGAQDRDRDQRPAGRRGRLLGRRAGYRPRRELRRRAVHRRRLRRPGPRVLGARGAGRRHRHFPPATRRLGG